MDKGELARPIRAIAQLEGDFVLRSGQLSSVYFDKYLFESDPGLLSEIVDHMSELIPPGTQILAGLEMGGLPIATGLSMQTKLPVVFVRKTAKEYGTRKLAEGMDIRNKKLCIIEDVVTTGGQVILSATELRRLGACVEHVVCVIERDKRARLNFAERNLELFSLYTMEEMV